MALLWVPNMQVKQKGKVRAKRACKRTAFDIHGSIATDPRAHTSEHTPESHQDVGVHETPGGIPSVVTVFCKISSKTPAVEVPGFGSQQIKSRNSCSSAVRLAPATGMELVGAHDRPGGATLLRTVAVPKGVLEVGRALFIATQDENAVNRHVNKSFLPDSMIVCLDN